MGRPAAIEWPDKAKICVTFIVPWEVWPENFGTHESLQRQGGATIPPPKAPFKQNMALVTEREYGDRVGRPAQQRQSVHRRKSWPQSRRRSLQCAGVQRLLYVRHRANAARSVADHEGSV